MIETDSIFSVTTSGLFSADIAQSEVENEDYEDFNDRIQAAPEFFQRLLGPLPQLTAGTIVAMGEYIMEGSLLTCSDGSYEPENDSACQAWVFADKEGHLLWGSAGPIDGHPAYHHPYRSA
mmetsp:Transcript_7234/g.10507  ORF Transcript_7234/g.10507 Transcript_7234/m.10507 type:complete len:121 (-) Transcript_7234:2173-2535(-)